MITTLIGVGVPLLIIGVAALLVVWVLSILRTVVATNMVHIVQSKKRTTSYGVGKDAGNVYLAWPSWVPFLGVMVTRLPESNFQVSLDNYSAYDKNRMPFVVDIMAFFRIVDSTKAAHRVSDFDELKRQLNAILQGSSRTILAKGQLEVLMNERASLGAQFTDEVDKQLEEWGVQSVKTVEFMDFRDAKDSKVIHQMMAKEQSRIDRESRETVAANNQAAKQREIEAQRQVDLSTQEAAQQVGSRTAEAQKVVGISNELAKQEILASARTTAERDYAVKMVQDTQAATIAKNVAEIQAEQVRNVVVIEADAARQTTLIKAEAERQQTEIIAKGQLQASLNNAEGIAAIGTAEGAAETAKLMAPVTAQITLADKISESVGYQNYLVSIREVEAREAVGKAQAAALEKAGIKIIANGGDVSSGINTIGDLISPKGGTALAGALTAFANTEEGKAIVSKFVK